jgi:hypothetical protein
MLCKSLSFATQVLFIHTHKFFIEVAAVGHAQPPAGRSASRQGSALVRRDAAARLRYLRPPGAKVCLCVTPTASRACGTQQGALVAHPGTLTPALPPPCSGAGPHPRQTAARTARPAHRRGARAARRPRRPPARPAAASAGRPPARRAPARRLPRAPPPPRPRRLGRAPQQGAQEALLAARVLPALPAPLARPPPRLLSWVAGAGRRCRGCACTRPRAACAAPCSPGPGLMVGYAGELAFEKALPAWPATACAAASGSSPPGWAPQQVSRLATAARCRRGRRLVPCHLRGLVGWLTPMPQYRHRICGPKAVCLLWDGRERQVSVMCTGTSRQRQPAHGCPAWPAGAQRPRRHMRPHPWPAAIQSRRPGAPA